MEHKTNVRLKENYTSLHKPEKSIQRLMQIENKLMQIDSIISILKTTVSFLEKQNGYYPTIY